MCGRVSSMPRLAVTKAQPKALSHQNVPAEGWVNPERVLPDSAWGCPGPCVLLLGSQASLVGQEAGGGGAEAPHSNRTPKVGQRPPAPAF